MKKAQMKNFKSMIALLVALLLPGLMLAVCFHFPLITEFSFEFVCIFGGVVFASYFIMLHIISNYLEEYDGRNVVGPVLIFLLAAALLIMIFGFGWNILHNFSTSAGSSNTTRFDAMYFSGITFFTIGYGDFVPNSNSGKLLALMEGFLGATHMVAFLAVLLKRGK